ncbi:MAG: 6-hydroxymethylpterin diphosphokinase MptE-like protein [Bermanella sp.]
MEDVLEIDEEQTSRLREAQALKEKNLAFFEKYHKKIYERFSELTLKNYKVSLNTDIKQMDLLYKGKSIYNGRPIAEAQETIAHFEESFAPGKQFKTIDPPFTGYMHPRFFHQRCNDLIKSSPVKPHNYLAYTVPDFYPLMIFNGVGSGYQIDIFFEKYDALNCVIIEKDPELFACSLYLIDWQAISQPFLDYADRNIHFIIGPFEEEDHASAYLLMYLGAHCPLYPVSTLFINHKNEETYNMVTDKINKDTNAFVSTWGYYDDEINQVNNCLHNLHLNIPIIKPNHEKLLDLPIFIIGAGPSLDDKIELIKEYKDKALIVSCGTAIHCLYKHGIKPDIQFELESDQCTVSSLDELGDPDWIRSIPMMGPSQLAPKLYKRFDKKVVFFKAESVTSMLFGDKDSSVRQATPTCSNGAIGVFAHWAFRRMFFFGLDFGYRDTSNHHASGSLYYTSTDPLMMADADVEPEAKIQIKAVDGSLMKTKPLLYTAMRTTEIVARNYRNYCTFYNCSNGAAMEHTQWIEGNELPMKAQDIDANLKIEFLKLQYEKPNVIDTKIMQEKLEVLLHNMKELGNYLIKEISTIKPNVYSLTSKINELSEFMENTLKPKVPAFYYFMRGSVWHLFYIGYSHALSTRNQMDLDNWIRTWKSKSNATIKEMAEHYKGVVFKEFDYDSDPWMTRSASDPE